MPIILKDGRKVDKIITRNGATVDKVTSFEARTVTGDFVDYSKNITDPSSFEDGKWYLFINDYDSTKRAVGHDGNQLWHFILTGTEDTIPDNCVWRMASVGGKAALVSRDGYYITTNSRSSSTNVKVTNDASASNIANITLSDSFSGAHKAGHIEIVDTATSGAGNTLNDAYNYHQQLIWWNESYGFLSYEVARAEERVVLDEKVWYENGLFIKGTVTDTTYVPRVYVNSQNTSSPSPSGGQWVDAELDVDTKTWKVNLKPYLPLTGMAFMFDRVNNYDPNTYVDKIVIPSGIDTSAVTSMRHMFERNSISYQNLSEIEGLSRLVTSNVTDMEYMFRNCTKLISLDVSNFDTSNVTKMGRMFADCNKLTSLDVSNFVTSKVTGMVEMFHSCYSLTTLDVSNFVTSKVESMYYMFYNCPKLTTLDISNFVTSNVTDMRGMFQDCTKLTTLDIPQIGNGTKSVQTDNMFASCDKLTNIPSCGEIHNTVSMSSCPLTLQSAKVVLNALSTPYSGSQTFTFKTSVLNACLADNEATELIWEAMDKGWTFAGMQIPQSVFQINSGEIQQGLSVENYATHTDATEYEQGKYYRITAVSSESVDFSNRGVNGGLDFTVSDTVNTIDVSNNPDLKYLAFNHDGDMTVKVYGTQYLTDTDWGKFIEDYAAENKARDLTIYFGETITIGDHEYDANGNIEESYVTFHFNADGTYTDDWDGCDKYALEDASSLITLTDEEWLASTYDRPSDAPSNANMWMSDSNYHKGNSFANAHFSVPNGIAKVDLYINSSAESSYDYTIAFGLDDDYTSTAVPAYNTSGVVANTRSFQKDSSGSIATNYKKVTYDIPSDGQDHTILVIYRKDSSGDHSYDRGFAIPTAFRKVLIPKPVKSRYITGTMVDGTAPKLTIDGGYITPAMDGNTWTADFDGDGPFDLGNFISQDRTNRPMNIKLETVAIADSMKDAPVSSVRSMFANTDYEWDETFRNGLTTINGVDKLNTSSTKDMRYMFDGCDRLTAIDGIEDMDTSSATGMTYMFRNCASLTSLDLTKWRTTKVEDWFGCFSGCSNLATLRLFYGIGNGIRTTACDTRYMFRGCTSLTDAMVNRISVGVDFSYCPLTLDSAKYIIAGLVDPWKGSQTITFGPTTGALIQNDSEALALVADRQMLGWTIAL